MKAAGNLQIRELNQLIKGLKKPVLNKEPDLVNRTAISKGQQKAINKVQTLASKAKDLLTTGLKHVISDFSGSIPRYAAFSSVCFTRTTFSEDIKKPGIEPGLLFKKKTLL